MDGPYPWLVSSSSASSSSSRRRRAASAKALSVHSSTYHRRDSSWNRRSRHSGRSLTRREPREGEMGVREERPSCKSTMYSRGVSC